MKRAVIIIFLVLLADQALKIWVNTHMSLGETIPMFGNWGNLHYVENRGMAFGLLIGGDTGKYALSIFRIVAIVGIGFYLNHIVRKGKSALFIISLSLIMAGAIGNVIDSAFYGMIFSEANYAAPASLFPPEGGYGSFLLGNVVDMFYFPIIRGHYPEWFPWKGGDYFEFFRPVFNIADASISVGVGILIAFQKRFFAKEDDILSESTDETEEELI